MMAYRSAEHETTRVRPAEMIFGRPIKLLAGLYLGRPPGDERAYSELLYVADLEEKLRRIHSFAIGRVHTASIIEIWRSLAMPRERRVCVRSCRDIQSGI